MRLSLLLTVALLPAAGLQGQEPPSFPQAFALTTEPTLVGKFKEARTFIKAEDWAEAVRVLQGIVEAPEDEDQEQLRAPRTGFVAYVPVGSIKRGENIVKTGANGRTIACGTCHGAKLDGLGPIPPLAGRSPSYLARQIWDLKQGARKGPLSTLMQQVKAKFPETKTATVLAQPTTSYEVLVQVMDTVREGTPAADVALAASAPAQGAAPARVELFPDISIGDAPVSVAKK